MLLVWLFHLSYSFIFFGCTVYHCVYGCKFCTLLFNFVNCVGPILFVLLCIFIVIYVPLWVFCFIVLFYVLFVCKCVLYCSHRVSTQFHLTNISYHIIQMGSLCRSECSFAQVCRPVRICRLESVNWKRE